MHFSLCRSAFLLGAISTAFICASAAEPKPLNAPSRPMTVSEARQAMAESLGHLDGVRNVRQVKFTRHKVTFVGDLGPGTYMPGTTLPWNLPFKGAENLSVKSTSRDHHNQVMSGGKWLNTANFTALFDSKPAATMFIDALLTLKAAEFAPDPEEEADFAAFTASAKSWLNATPKPEMSDDARAYKMLAEDAFKRKDFAAALEAYDKALEKHPMWPSGHYNAALLAAEIQDYDLAAQHMRRYLVLAPDAKDASVSKDKFLLWQLKAKQ